ncbi:MAG: hypothetical protein IMZ62_10530 [Chloroflexi bacterium]|nr:hypothetical protein [Chloroflexota bacterium]
MMLAGAIPGAVVALASWVMGVVISAQGQMLLASLDTAVSVSPFLEPDQKARVLGLPA